ncbi:hypothetical protein N8810_04230 [Flavobacteriaceae bacterium]|nr:hypothetical protein [Flavobacteriaceae bacterium]
MKKILEWHISFTEKKELHMGYLTIKHTGFLGLKELFMASF